MEPPRNALTLDVDVGASPTFCYFVTAGDVVAFDPAAHRIFLRFAEKDIARGGTIVAVRTL